MASALREEWLLGLDPIPSMSALLEDKGIKLSKRIYRIVSTEWLVM